MIKPSLRAFFAKQPPAHPTAQFPHGVQLISLSLQIMRTGGWQDYMLTLPEGASVLDALEEAGRHDPSLLFRHSCHHASCGSCGMRIDSRERLACITPLRELLRRGRPLRLEPLRNFPLLGDLLVDFAPFMESLERIDLPLLREVEGGPVDKVGYERFENCIECGLCVSACPIAGSDPLYAGPAVLAAAWRLVEEPRRLDPRSALQLAAGEHGAWRCHAAFECTEVCPANVDPANAIMSLRRLLMRK